MVSIYGINFQAKENVDLDFIAELLGTSGTGERQKERHIREREEQNRIITRKKQEIV
jgi:hypothetical protein